MNAVDKYDNEEPTNYVNMNSMGPRVVVNSTYGDKRAESDTVMSDIMIDINALKLKNSLIVSQIEEKAKIIAMMESQVDAAENLIKPEENTEKKQLLIIPKIEQRSSLSPIPKSNGIDFLGKDIPTIQTEEEFTRKLEELESPQKSSEARRISLHFLGIDKIDKIENPSQFLKVSHLESPLKGLQTDESFANSLLHDITPLIPNKTEQIENSAMMESLVQENKNLKGLVKYLVHLKDNKNPGDSYIGLNNSHLSEGNQAPSLSVKKR